MHAKIFTKSKHASNDEPQIKALKTTTKKHNQNKKKQNKNENKALQQQKSTKQKNQQKNYLRYQMLFSTKNRFNAKTKQRHSFMIMDSKHNKKIKSFVT